MCGGRERKSGSSAERSIGEGGKNLDAQTLGAASLGTGTTSEKTIIAAPGKFSVPIPIAIVMRNSIGDGEQIRAPALGPQLYRDNY